MEHKFEIQKNNIESENKKYVSSNKLDNGTMEHECEQLNSKNKSKDNKIRIFSNNLDNIINE